MKKKRKAPGLATILNRKKLINQTVILKDDDICNFGFIEGNGKTGNDGGIVSEILIWSLPAGITCPGASSYCRKVCYAAEKKEYEINNLKMFLNNREELHKYINEKLENTGKKVAVRIHSAGDFFSREYIEFWHEIVTENPHILFWTYTKSWRIRELAIYIEKLDMLQNINIYYSWDRTMGEYLLKHKRAILTKTIKTNTEQKEVICPEQYELVHGCAECGICFFNQKRDVIFYLH